MRPVSSSLFPVKRSLKTLPQNSSNQRAYPRGEITEVRRPLIAGNHFPSPPPVKVMKAYRIQWTLALILSASAYAKPPNGRPERIPQGPPPQGPPPQGPPLLIVLDTDRDGVLSDIEIKAAAEVIAKLDKNHDGKITIEELRMPPPPRGGEGPQGPPPRDEKRPVPPVIHALDADHDGTISAQEMQNAPESLKALDKNGDGELSPDEMRPQGPPPPREGPPSGDEETQVE